MHVRYGNNPKTKLFQETGKLHHKAIRKISFLPKGASVKEAYNTLKIKYGTSYHSKMRSW